MLLSQMLVAFASFRSWWIFVGVIYPFSTKWELWSNFGLYGFALASILLLYTNENGFERKDPKIEKVNASPFCFVFE